MKKASVITLQYVNNFGSVLQTLATQETLKSMNYESEIVDYTRENFTYSYLRNEALKRYKNMGGLFSLLPIRKLLIVRWSFLTKAQQKIFDAFRKKYLNLSKKYASSQELIADPPVADVYITGSDQVWNPEYNGGVLGEYYLNYAPKFAPKIALSASIGIETIDRKYVSEMAKYTNDYDAISVREKSALKVLEQLGYSRAIHVVDPTLMLTKEDWTQRLNLRETEKPYVLMYQLNTNENMKEFAAKIANDNKIDLIIISSHCKKVNCRHKFVKNCSPEHFLELIKNAKYVVTDSFHGTAFSFNFNRNVFVFNPPKYSTRLTSVLELFKSEFRLVDNKDWKDIEPLNYEQINKILSVERDKVKKFLLEHLD